MNKTKAYSSSTVPEGLIGEEDLAGCGEFGTDGLLELNGDADGDAGVGAELLVVLVLVAVD